MFQETSFVSCIDDCEGIIYKSSPETGGCGDESMDFFSKSSIKRLTTIGLIGEPIAAPSCCSYSLPWKVKYILLKQNSRRLMIWLTDMLVLCWSSPSSSNNFLMISMADCISTDVNSAFTSWDMIHWCYCSFMPCICCMKSLLFWT